VLTKPDKWAVIYGSEKNDRFFDTELRYDTRELAEQAIDLAKR
jgi:hypothetical protein